MLFLLSVGKKTRRLKRNTKQNIVTSGESKTAVRSLEQSFHTRVHVRVMKNAYLDNERVLINVDAENNHHLNNYSQFSLPRLQTLRHAGT